MGNTITEMTFNAQKTPVVPLTLHTPVCTHICLCTIILKWQLCSFFLVSTPILNPVTQILWSKRWKLKITKTQNKRLPNYSSTVLVWTCNKQWHRGMWLDGMNGSVHPVRQIDWQHLYVLEGRGRSVLDDTRKYSTLGPQTWIWFL